MSTFIYRGLFLVTMTTLFVVIIISVNNMASLQTAAMARITSEKLATTKTEKVSFGQIISENTTSIAGNLTIDGKLTVDNVIYQVQAGDGIGITSGQSPTITNTDPGSLQAIFKKITTGGESFSATSNTDALTFAAGDGISLSADKDKKTITINNTQDTGVTSFQGSSGEITLTEGSGISISDLTITNNDKGSAQNIFKTIMAGTTDIAATSNTDTLTLAAGSGISLSSDTSLQQITISAPVTYPTLNQITDVSTSSLSNNQMLLWDSSSSTWQNNSFYEATGKRDETDYLIYVSNNTCYVFDGSTGALAYSDSDHAVCIQYAIDSAGTGGTLSFREGTYTIGTELQPKTNQTWWVNKNAVFVPSGNNRILNIVSIDGFTIHGTLFIDDTNSVTTSVEAIRIDDMSNSFFDHIVINSYYRGMSIYGATGGVNENSFIDVYMHVSDRGLSLENSCHDNHFLHVWIKGPSPTEWATGAGLYIATDGTQGGNVFNNMEVLDMQTGLDLPGAFEAFFGNVLVDNPYSAGISIGGSVERLFFDTIWASSGGDGVVMQGDSNSSADKIQIGKIYAWLNGNYGVRMNGYVDDVMIDSMFVQRNDKGFAITGSNNTNISVGSLTSMENTTVGVDGSGITSAVYVQNAIIHDSITSRSSFTDIHGIETGSGTFTARGVATVISGQSSVTVTHGLADTPTNVLLTPYDQEVVGAYVSARSATTFVITVGSAVTGDREISWEAR